MPAFKVVLIEHGYATTVHERKIITAAGGQFVDADTLALRESLRACEDADAVLLRRISVTPEIIARFKRCKIILRYGVGTDNVDLAAATRANIIVGHVPAYCVDEVSTHAIALLLDSIRRIVPTHKKMEDGEWDVHRSDPIYRTSGKTLGLIGLGAIGRAVARKLAGWQMNLIACDPYILRKTARACGVELVDFETLCTQSDYISVHCPLLPETRHLIDDTAIEMMKRGVVVVNTARGLVVDSEALLRGLRRGKVYAAGLDVFEEEPLPASARLRRHARVTLTDHTAWYSEQSQVELQRTAAEEVVRVCTGRLPKAIANPEVLERIGRERQWKPSEQARWQLRRLQALQQTKVQPVLWTGKKLP